MSIASIETIHEAQFTLRSLLNQAFFCWSMWQIQGISFFILMWNTWSHEFKGKFGLVKTHLYHLRLYNYWINVFVLFKLCWNKSTDHF